MRSMNPQKVSDDLEDYMIVLEIFNVVSDFWTQSGETIVWFAEANTTRLLVKQAIPCEFMAHCTNKQRRSHSVLCELKFRKRLTVDTHVYFPFWSTRVPGVV